MSELSRAGTSKVCFTFALNTIKTKARRIRFNLVYFTFTTSGVETISRRVNLDCLDCYIALTLP
jgi:hypothetical protein